MPSVQGDGYRPFLETAICPCLLYPTHNYSARTGAKAADGCIFYVLAYNKTAFSQFYKYSPARQGRLVAS